MKVSERLYNSAIGLWRKNLEHPFVRGMADGTLPLEKFRFFIVQDHLYLMQYVKVLAIGLLKATNEEDMRHFSAAIRANLDTENEVHRNYLKRLGITREMIDSAVPSIVTDSYTHFMIATAEKGGLPEIMAAVLACSWSYQIMGDWLATIPGAAEQPYYGEWVEMYLSEGFHRANQKLIDMTDRFCANCTEEQLRNLEHIVDVCSQYEYMFWDMAWNEKEREI